MPNLYTLKTASVSGEILTNHEIASILYHDFFDYPLNLSDLIRWKVGDQLPITVYQLSVCHKDGYLFIDGKEGLIYKRILRRRVSAKKMQIARDVARVLSLIPSIKLVATTGSLAMENANDESDIDLMIVTSKGMLWTTRLLVYFSLLASRFSLRRPKDKFQKDKLCLNIWLDERDLSWSRGERNLYTAHEIAQIVPLVNKDRTYERFLYKNKWILKYWPNSVKIRNPESEIRNKFRNSNFKYLNLIPSFVLRASNLIAFKIQYQYMRSSITREVVTPTRALFHPQDWGKVVLDRLNSYL